MVIRHCPGKSRTYGDPIRKVFFIRLCEFPLLPTARHHRPLSLTIESENSRVFFIYITAKGSARRRRRRDSAVQSSQLCSGECTRRIRLSPARRRVPCAHNIIIFINGNIVLRCTRSQSKLEYIYRTLKRRPTTPPYEYFCYTPCTRAPGILILSYTDRSCARVLARVYPRLCYITCILCVSVVKNLRRFH